MDVDNSIFYCYEIETKKDKQNPNRDEKEKYCEQDCCSHEPECFLEGLFQLCNLLSKTLENMCEKMLDSPC